MSKNLFELYSQKILALATQIPSTEPLARADGEASKRSPICGSQIEVQIALQDEKIAEYSQKVNACALGQASSAIFAQSVIGTDQSDLQNLRQELISFLRKQGETPSPPFEGYALLEPAQDHKNRHASIMLPVETTLLALEDAKKNRP